MAGLLDEFDVGEDVLAAVGKEIRMLWLLWAGCFVTYPVFILVIVVLGDQVGKNEQIDANVVNLLMLIFSVVAAGAIALSVFLRKKFASNKLRIVMDLIIKQGMGNKDNWRERLRIGMILCLALVQVAGVFGFLLCFLSGNYLLFGLFMVAGIGASIYHRPSREEAIGCYQKFSS